MKVSKNIQLGMEKFSYGEIKILVCRTIWAPAAVSVGFSSQIFTLLFLAKSWMYESEIWTSSSLLFFSSAVARKSRKIRQRGFHIPLLHLQVFLSRIAMVSCCCNALIFFSFVTLLKFVILFWCYDLWWLDEICGENFPFFYLPTDLECTIDDFAG